MFDLGMPELISWNSLVLGLPNLPRQSDWYSGNLSFMADLTEIKLLTQ